MSQRPFTLMKLVLPPPSGDEMKKSPFRRERHWVIPAFDGVESQTFREKDAEQALSAAEEICKNFRKRTGKLIYPVLFNVNNYVDRVDVRLGNKAQNRISTAPAVSTRVWNIVWRQDPLAKSGAFFGQIIIKGERISICTQILPSAYSTEPTRKEYSWSNIEYAKRIKFFEEQIAEKARRDEAEKLMAKAHSSLMEQEMKFRTFSDWIPSSDASAWSAPQTYATFTYSAPDPLRTAPPAPLLISGRNQGLFAGDGGEAYFQRANDLIEHEITEALGRMEVYNTSLEDAMREVNFGIGQLFDRYRPMFMGVQVNGAEVRRRLSEGMYEDRTEIHDEVDPPHEEE